MLRQCLQFTPCAVNLLPPRVMGGFAANIIYGMKMYFIRLFYFEKIKNVALL